MKEGQEVHEERGTSSPTGPQDCQGAEKPC